MTETKRMKIVVTYALPSEEVEISWPEAELVTVFTDVGKVKAAIAVTHALHTEKPDLVLNVGTAGTINHSVGDIIAGSTYIDRDYAPLGLPGIEWQFASEGGSLGLPSVIDGREQTGSFAISTGDNFVTRDRGSVAVTTGRSPQGSCSLFQELQTIIIINRHRQTT